MKRHIPDPRVALVYPPFGPPHLASLGLANLSAGIKARGLSCRTFYWSYRFARMFPGVPDDRKAQMYFLFTQRAMSPWNEWAFMRYALPERLKDRDAEVLRLLADVDRRTEAHTHPLTASSVILALANGMEEILASMAADLEPYDVIGVGTTFFQSGAALALCKYIKDQWPDKLTVLGGANCDGEMGGALIDNFSFIDCVFTGEVDHEFPEFIQRLHEGAPFHDIKGLRYRDPGQADGAVVRNPPSQPITDMNALPVPEFDDWIEERKKYGYHDLEKTVLPLEASRGCWWGAKHHCTFCGLNANGMDYRQKSAPRFQGELKEIMARYGVKYFFMADNILPTNFHKTFIQWAKEEGIGVDMFYEIKANMSREQVADMAGAGLSMVQPGIEHFSSKILKLMDKGVRGIQNIAFLKYAAEHGVITVYSILSGFPGEDPHEYSRLARELPKLVHLRPPGGLIEIEFHRFSPYHNDPDRFGIRLRPHPKYSFIFPVPEPELAKLAYQFELIGRRTEDLSYLNKLQQVVAGWQQQFQPLDCTLTWNPDGADIVIADRRAGTTPRALRLRGHAATVFPAFEKPTAIEQAVIAGRQLPQLSPAPAGGKPRPASQWNLPETIISFTRKELEENPARCLSSLVECGVLYEEDGFYLNLPVRHDYREVPGGWATVLLQ